MQKIEKLKLTDWLIIAVIVCIPIIIVLNLYKGLDGDIWYILAEGRYILKNGIYHVDKLSLHEGLDIVVQNWLFSVIFWIIYAFLGLSSIYTVVILINIVICYLLYKISMLLSNNNKLVSTFTTVLTDINLAMYFIVSKPQILSFVIILLLIYLLELYIKKDDSKYLKFIPLLSLIEINMHAAFWWYIILFMIPYIIDSFKNHKLGLQGYRKKPLIIIFVLSILIAFINPYGYKAIIFIFKSFGNPYMHNFIAELKVYKFNALSSFHIFAVGLFVAVLSTLYRKGQVRFRYICLFIGTLSISMVAVKGMCYFMLVSIFPLALLLKNVKINNALAKKILTVILAVIALASTTFAIYFCYTFNNNHNLEYQATDALNAIESIADNYPATVYTSLNDGGYVEFRGYKAYIDPRAEAFLKINNNKEDILSEYYNFQAGGISKEDLLKKYNFDFLLINSSDILYFEDSIDNYLLIYNNIDTFYKIYIRNDLISEEAREAIINEYNK